VSQVSNRSEGLGDFLVQEMAPTPHRWRASIRLSITATLATAAVMALHVPQGEYLVVLLFLVGQNDVWASPRRAALRVVWLVLGCIFVVWALGAFVEKPWVRFPLQSIVLGGTIFLGRTTTAPFAVMMLALCFLLGVPEYVGAPEQDLEQALWRLLMVGLGVVLGTLVQLAVWRERPQDLLRLDLARRLRRTEEVLQELLAGAPPGRGRQRPGLVAATGLTRQLDLLDAAEAETSWLRQRHAEQLKLITEVQVVVRGALRLERELDAPGGPPALAPELAVRLGAIRTAIVGVAEALEREAPDRALRLQPPAQPSGIARSELGVRLAMNEIENALAAIPGLLGFLGAPALTSPPRAPKEESDPRQPFFTSGFRMDNVVDLRVALKAALAITVCGLLYQALSWPGLSACIFATLVLAQGSVGASFQRAVVQILFVLVGAGWALLVVTMGMPNMTGLASLLVFTLPLFFGVAWVCTGPGVSNTAGVQMAMGGVLVLLPGLGPTINLIPARDRLLGILLGNVVFALINLSVWPVYAGGASRVASILRELAGLLRPSDVADPRRSSAQAFGIYRSLARGMALLDEARFEPLSRVPHAAESLQTLLDASVRIQDLFLEVLSLKRLDVQGRFTALPVEPTRALGELEAAVAERLEGLGALLEGTSLGAPSRMEQAVQSLERSLEQAAPALVSAPPQTADVVLLSATRLVEAVNSIESALQARLAAQSQRQSGQSPGGIIVPTPGTFGT
jgi:multidrug resistance protein MdtO